MKDNKGVWASLAALLPALVLAATGYMEARSQKDQKLDLADNYSEYVVDRMERDAALERALLNCMALLPAVPAAAAEDVPEGLSPEEERIFRGLQGSATLAERAPPEMNLDDVAEEFGYEQRTAPQ